MIKFKEVQKGFTPEEDVDLLRVATSSEGDLITLVKLKGEEQYQLAIVLANGTEAFDTYFDGEFANNLFSHILTL